jgi:phosphate transport system permease protein
MEVSMQVVVPAALSGIAASFILAISRAVGETMIVAIAAGNSPILTANVFKGIQTMTGYIVQVSLGDVPHGTLEYQTIFAVGLVLFSITVVMNLISIALVRRFQQKYD